MKKLLALAGLCTITATALQAAYAPGLSSMERNKPWSVSASVRGFYDDNYTTSPRSTPGGVPNSFGFELSPSAAINLPYEQTFLGASYVYSMKYYENRAHKNQSSADHSHQFNARINHAFSERYQLEASEQFVIAQEPEVLNPTGAAAPLVLRANGNNIRNTFGGTFTAQLTQTWGSQLAYHNNYYDYEQTGVGSYSATLDRMEHAATIDLRYQWLPTTVVLGGYRFGAIDYLSDEALATNVFGASIAQPTIRNNYSHTLFVGADHNFTAKLNGSIRAGGSYYDYYNGHSTDISPYAEANLSYTYARGSYVQGGVSHTRSQSDLIGVLDTESTLVYLSLTHRITSSLTGSLLGQYQHAAYNSDPVAGFATNNGADDYFVASVNLAYRIDPAGHWLAEAGYNFDKLISDQRTFGTDLRSYNRNRVYIGIRATY